MLETAPIPCPDCGRLFETSARVCPFDGTVLVPEASLAGVVLPGGYRVGQVIGRGGMGIVYEALHTTTGRSVAIKTLSADSLGRADRVRRFGRELRLSARLSHPGIVAVLDFGATASGMPFLVMEFVRGIALSRLTLPLSVTRTATIALQVANALESAHALGIIHRDLKPGNIMLLEGSGIYEDAVKVLDFGLAMEQDPDETTSGTATGVLLGTPSCISPEAIAGGTITPAADHYALGVLIYLMVTGRPVFEGAAGTLLVQHLNERPPSLSAEHPEALRRLVQELLAKEPAHRPTAPRIRQVLTQLASPPRSAPLDPAVVSPGSAPADDAGGYALGSVMAGRAHRQVGSGGYHLLVAAELVAGVEPGRGGRGAPWRGNTVRVLATAAAGLAAFFALRLASASKAETEPGAAGEPGATTKPRTTAEPGATTDPKNTAEPGAATGQSVVDRVRPTPRELTYDAHGAGGRRGPEGDVGVTISSEPPGAAVWDGTQWLGPCPLTARVAPSHALRLTVIHPAHGAQLVTARAGDGPVVVYFDARVEARRAHNARRRSPVVADTAPAPRPPLSTAEPFRPLEPTR